MSAARATPEAKNVPLITPTFSRSTISDPTKEVLNISFPRCSCCHTSWYDAHELGGEDDFADAQKLAVSVGKRKRHRDRPSQHHLLPMPNCECTTRLALPPLPSVIYSQDCCDPSDVLNQIKTVSFPNLAICRSCLKHRIAASKEVTVHDYHQGHIPNGQRDVKFTVELCCVQCKRKFSVRFLEKLLKGEGAASSKNVAVKNKKQGGKPETNNWHEAVEATIEVVGWAKRGMRMERRKIRQRQIGLNDSSEPDLRLWNNLAGFTGGDGNCSSDECYSFSFDASDDDDDDKLLHPSKRQHRQEVQPGELMAELLQKDPLFRQEKEDEQYVKNILEEQESHIAKVDALNAQAIEDEIFAKQLIEQENEAKQKAADERLRRDHEIAIKIQKNLNKQASTSEKEDEQYVKKILKEQESHRLKVDAFNTQVIEDETFAKQLIEQENEAKRKAADERVRRDHEIAIKIQQNLNKQASTSEPVKTRSKSSIADAWKKLSAVAEMPHREKSRTPVSADNNAKRMHADEECSNEISVICVRPADSSYGAASPTVHSRQFPNINNQNRTRGKQSDEQETSQVSEKLVDEIMAMGFSKSLAKRSLRLANGNLQQAVDLILSEAADDRRQSEETVERRL